MRGREELQEGEQDARDGGEGRATTRKFGARRSSIDCGGGNGKQEVRRRTSRFGEGKQKKRRRKK